MAPNSNQATTIFCDGDFHKNKKGQHRKLWVETPEHFFYDELVARAALEKAKNSSWFNIVLLPATTPSTRIKTTPWLGGQAPNNTYQVNYEEFSAMI